MLKNLCTNAENSSTMQSAMLVACSNHSQHFYTCSHAAKAGAGDSQHCATKHNIVAVTSEGRREGGAYRGERGGIGGGGGGGEQMSNLSKQDAVSVQDVVAALPQ